MSGNDKDISHKIIDETAALAKLKIADDERELVADKLDKVLNLYKIMGECDTNSINLIDSQVNVVTQLREDVVSETDNTKHMCENFDNFNDQKYLFEVPKVIEE